MSFVINIMENDTLKYWKNKLKWKWYQIPFLVLKNIEIEAFMSEYIKSSPIKYDGQKFFELSKKTNSIGRSSKLAIVVPIYVNSEKSKKQVERLISSILSQKRKADYVFLIDDCSPISYDTKGLEIHKMKNNGGPAKARNYGLLLSKKVKADIVAFTDSDVILSPNWTTSIIKTFRDNRYMQAISGKTLSYGKTLYDLYHNINGTLNGRKFKNSKQLLYGPTCNFAIELESIGDIAFSEDFPLAAGEDIEFCYRILKEGNNIGFGSRMIVHHDYGYKSFLFFKNKINFIKIFKKYARGEKILLNKIPEYYHFLNETREIASK